MYTAIDMKSGNIRWKKSASTDALSASDATSLKKSNFVLTDTYLATYGISSIRDLKDNSVYTLSNVTRSKLANMPDDKTEGSVEVYTGILYKFCGYDHDSFQTSYIYINNKGILFSGVDFKSGDVRWKSYMDGSAPALYSSIDNRMSKIYNKKVLILGDSIVYGSHMPDKAEGDRTVVTLSDGTVYKNNTSTTVWSNKFVNYLADTYSDEVTNNAWPGARYQDLLTYYDQIVGESTYDYVFIVMGVNNWSSGGLVISSLDDLKAKFDAMGANMIIVTPLPSSTLHKEVAQICGIIKKWGADHNMEIADLYSEFNYLNYIHGKELSDVLLDGVHYNADSQIDIFESVKHILKI